jgi:hypothetical protein
VKEDKSNRRTGRDSKNTPQKKKHYFFLNPYKDCAFTKCPKCGGKTKIRKFPLAIHIEPQQLFCLNKTCRYCANCDLIITKKSEVESLMTAAFEGVDPSIIGNKYLVFGTLEKSDWRKYSKVSADSSEAIERVYVFKDVLNFEVVRAGWYLSD